MTINYEEWQEKEYEAYYEFRDRAIDKFMRKEASSPLDIAPELEIDKGQLHTIWDPPGSPEILRKHPENDLRNLEAIYASKEGKIIIPIDRRYDRSEFENWYGMSVKDLTSHLRENPDHLKPVILKPPLRYKGIGFYDELFAACREVYERYPIYGPRLLDFLGELKVTVIAEREGIPDTEDWYKRVLEAHPEYDFDKCFEEMKELFEIDGKKA